jgi:hypothetical protein
MNIAAFFYLNMLLEQIQYMAVSSLFISTTSQPSILSHSTLLSLVMPNSRQSFSVKPTSSTYLS